MVFRKRGTTHIDWVISLGIFLFYIVWFFVFINPIISQTTELTPISYSIKEKLQTSVYEPIYKTPIFISLNENRTDELVIINFTPRHGKNSLFLEEDYYFYNNKLYLLRNYSQENRLIEITESNSTYNQTYQNQDLNFQNNKVQTSKELSTEFEKSTLKKADYKNINRIDNFKIRLEEDDITIKNETNISNGLYYQKNLESQKINFSTIIFAKNSIIFFSSEKNDKQLNKKINISMDINNFDNYFIDNEEFGNIIFNSSDCIEKEGDYLKFFDNQDSLGFILPDNTSINLCFDETNTKLTLILPNLQITESYFYFENNSYTKSDFFDYTYKKGVLDEANILSLEKLNNLNYSQLKNEIGIPDERNFQIMIWNNTLLDVSRDKLLFEIGEEQTSSNNVYVSEYSDYLNLDDKTKTRVTIGIKVW